MTVVNPLEAVGPRELVTTFAEIGREITTRGDGGNALDGLIRSAVKRIPGAEWASITQYRAPNFQTVASTDERATQADRLQYALGSGPCLDAIVEDTIFRPDDIANDPLWPEYGRRVSAEFGVASMLSFRLEIEADDVVGCLNLYSRERSAFSDGDLSMGLLLATHAAWALANLMANNKAATLQNAVESNRDIGIAIGILMASHKITREAAFDLLRITSQGSHRKLREVATDVMETGILSVPLQAEGGSRSRPRPGPPRQVA
jgi:GAF domain-containing protein